MKFLTHFLTSGGGGAQGGGWQWGGRGGGTQLPYPQLCSWLQWAQSVYIFCDKNRYILKAYSTLNYKVIVIVFSDRGTLFPQRGRDPPLVNYLSMVSFFH